MPYQTDQPKEMILTINFYSSWCKKGVESFHKHILSTQNEIQDCSQLANQKFRNNFFSASALILEVITINTINSVVDKAN